MASDDEGGAGNSDGESDDEGGAGNSDGESDRSILLEGPEFGDEASEEKRRLVWRATEMFEQLQDMFKLRRWHP
eukprot:517343-Alexandrium_andersonii.AAC.1